MARNPEYAKFINQVEGRVKDDLPTDEETRATEQEIGWWKKVSIYQNDSSRQSRSSYRY